MNLSVPLSPPLMTAALIRMAATSPTIAQNSVVLNACLVSVVRRRAVRAMPVRWVARSPPVAPVVAMSQNSLVVGTSPKHRSRRVATSVPALLPLAQQSNVASPLRFHLAGPLVPGALGDKPADALTSARPVPVGGEPVDLNGADPQKRVA